MMNSIRRSGRHLVLVAALTSCSSVVHAVEPAPPDRALATFAGGCFWCMEGPFDELDGVLSTTSGYTGGEVEQPTYEQVSAGTTGHTEAVQIVYDPAQVSYAELLDVFWRNIDPTTPDRQFCDKGSQYRPAIFYHDDAQHETVQTSLAQIKKVKTFAEPIQVEIAAAAEFYPAEEYHQDFYLKNPIRYRYYRYRCGRDERLEALWGQSH
ncbi:MAG: peptide-methionine (S)-S-oxide reductase MsrA, partial [Gammaproteobacteria bacterium]